MNARSRLGNDDCERNEEANLSRKGSKVVTAYSRPEIVILTPIRADQGVQAGANSSTQTEGREAGTRKPAGKMHLRTRPILQERRIKVFHERRAEGSRKKEKRRRLTCSLGKTSQSHLLGHVT